MRPVDLSLPSLLPPQVYILERAGLSRLLLCLCTPGSNAGTPVDLPGSP